MAVQDEMTAKDSHLSNSMDSPCLMSCLLATHSVMLHGAGPLSRLQAASLTVLGLGWEVVRLQNGLLLPGEVNSP